MWVDASAEETQKALCNVFFLCGLAFVESVCCRGERNKTRLFVVVVSFFGGGGPCGYSFFGEICLLGRGGDASAEKGSLLVGSFFSCYSLEKGMICGAGLMPRQGVVSSFGGPSLVAKRLFVHFSRKEGHCSLCGFLKGNWVLLRKRLLGKHTRAHVYSLLCVCVCVCVGVCVCFGTDSHNNRTPCPPPLRISKTTSK